jgi:hypothetical protein
MRRIEFLWPQIFSNMGQIFYFLKQIWQVVALLKKQYFMASSTTTRQMASCRRPKIAYTQGKYGCFENNPML